jgi:hypothetical protein
MHSERGNNNHEYGWLIIELSVGNDCMAGVWCKFGFSSGVGGVERIGDETWWRRRGGCVHKGN